MKTSIQFGYSYFYKSIMQVASFLEATNSQPLLWSKAYWLLNTSPLSSPQPMPSVHAAQNPGQKHENTKGIVSENLWEAWAITLYSKQVITQHSVKWKALGLTVGKVLTLMLQAIFAHHNEREN